MRAGTLALIGLAAFVVTAAARDDNPYFASLRADKVYMREGPSKEHRVKWIYWRKGLPVEVVASFDVWRRVRDMDGEMGWVHSSMLSRKRTAIVLGKSPVSLHAEAGSNSNVTAEVQPGAIGELRRCVAQACEIRFETADGWIERSRLWGVSLVAR